MRLTHTQIMTFINDQAAQAIRGVPLTVDDTQRAIIELVNRTEDAPVTAVQLAALAIHSFLGVVELRYPDADEALRYLNTFTLLSELDGIVEGAADPGDERG